MTANYSYGGLAWDQKLRDAVTNRFRLKLSNGLFQEQPVIAVGDPNLLKSGKPAGTQTQKPLPYKG